MINNSQQFYHWCTYGTNFQHVTSDLPILFGEMIYLGKTGKYLQIFMLSIMCLYFSWYILVGYIIIYKIQC